jgi:hypothetical protein
MSEPSFERASDLFLTACELEGPERAARELPELVGDEAARLESRLAELESSTTDSR